MKEPRRYEAEGIVVLYDHERRSRDALSERKPFCDGTHHDVGFEG